MNTLARRNFDTNLSRFLDNFFDDTTWDISWKGSTNSYPKVDVSETSKEVVIDAAVPGLSMDDLEVLYENGRLAISGEKVERCKDANYNRTELHRSKFTRSWLVPENQFDVTNIGCSLKDGILNVVIPKIRAPDENGNGARKIPISN